VQNDIPESDATVSFCRQLFQRMPRCKSGVVKTKNNSSTSNRDLIRESESYDMVAMDDEEQVAQFNLTKDQSEKTKKDKKRDRPDKKEITKEPKMKSKSRSRHHGDEGSSSEDETVIKRSAPKVVSVIEDTLNETDETDKLQKQMDADIEERDAFIARMLEKEEGKTKKLAEKGLTSEQISELATRGSVSSGTMQEQRSTVDQLRETSRQYYLEKREGKG
jgi:hypothetical protein